MTIQKPVNMLDELPNEQEIVECMHRWIRDEEPVWPYAKILEVWGDDFEMYRRTRNWRMVPSLDNVVAMHRLRRQWIERFGFAIPCAELLDQLAKSKIVLEVGAGTGYMTKLMRNRKINVVGTDAAPRGKTAYGFEVGQFDPWQLQLEAKTAVRRFRHADTVFCSWPSYNETWFRQMLKAMRVGQRLIVIREDATGDNTAWEYFDSAFEHVDDVDIPAFANMNDYACIGVKKKQNAELAA